MTDLNVPESASFDPADIEKNKVIAGLSYILFFLPLIACPTQSLAGSMPIKLYYF